MAIKKFIFAPIFLLFIIITAYYFSANFRSIDKLFAFGFENLFSFIILSALIILTSLFFVVFATLAFDWKIILPVIMISAALPMTFLPLPNNFIVALGLFLTHVLIYVLLENKLKTYLSFQPKILLFPSIKNLAKLFIFIIAISYFLSVNLDVQKNGFQLPDSLIDSVLKLIPQAQEVNQLNQLNISSEQIAMLKENPQALAEYGLDLKILDSLTDDSQNVISSQSFIKQTVKNQLKNMINPYIQIVPAVLAIIFYITLTSFASFLSMFTIPLLWLIFYVLKAAGFVKFVSEMREVKKLVV